MWQMLALVPMLGLNILDVSSSRPQDSSRQAITPAKPEQPRVWVGSAWTGGDVSGRLRDIRLLNEEVTRAEERMAIGDLAGAAKICLDAMTTRQKMGIGAGSTLLDQTLAEIYFRAGRYVDALSLYLQDPAGGSNANPNLVKICLAYCRLGDYRSALTWYEKVREQQWWAFDWHVRGKLPLEADWPGTRSIRSLEASALIVLGRCGNAQYNEPAFRELVRAPRLAPRSALVAFEVGSALESRGRLDEASRMYSIAANVGHGVVAEESVLRTNAITSRLDADGMPQTKRPSAVDSFR